MRKKLFFLVFLFSLSFLLYSCIENLVSVKFVDVNGDLIEEVLVERNTKLEERVGPKIEGQEFIGWYLGDTNFVLSETLVTTDIILKATYKTLEHTITFYNDNILVDTVKVKDGLTLEKIDLEDTLDRVFLGWYLGDTKYDFTEIVKSSFRLDAKFKDKELVNYYTLTLPEYVTSNLTSLNQILEDTNVILTINLPSKYTLESLRVNNAKVILTNNTYKFVITKNTVVEITYKEKDLGDYQNLTLNELNNFLSNIDLKLFNSDNFEFDFLMYQNDVRSSVNGSFNLDNNLGINYFTGKINSDSNTNTNYAFVNYYNNMLYLKTETFDTNGNVIEKQATKFEYSLDNYGLAIAYGGMFDNNLYTFTNLNILIETIFNEYLRTIKLEEVLSDNGLFSIKKKDNNIIINLNVSLNDLYNTKNNYLKLLINNYIGNNLPFSKLDFEVELNFIDNKINDIKLSFDAIDSNNNNMYQKYEFNKIANFTMPEINEKDYMLEGSETLRVNYHVLNETYSYNYSKQFYSIYFYPDINFYLHGYILEGIYFDPDFNVPATRYDGDLDIIDLYFNYILVDSLEDVLKVYLNDDMLELDSFQYSYFEYLEHVFIQNKYDNSYYYYYNKNTKEFYISSDYVNFYLIDYNFESVRERLSKTKNYSYLLDTYFSLDHLVLFNSEQISYAPKDLKNSFLSSMLYINKTITSNKLLDYLDTINLSKAKPNYNYQILENEKVIHETEVSDTVTVLIEYNNITMIYTLKELLDKKIVTKYEVDIINSKITIYFSNLEVEELTSYTIYSDINEQIYVVVSEGIELLKKDLLSYNFGNKNFYELNGFVVNGNHLINNLNELDSLGITDKYIFINPKYTLGDYSLFLNYLKTNKLKLDSFTYDYSKKQFFNYYYDFLIEEINGLISIKSHDFQFLVTKASLYNLSDEFRDIKGYLEFLKVFELLLSETNVVKTKDGYSSEHFNIIVGSNEIRVTYNEYNFMYIYLDDTEHEVPIFNTFFNYSYNLTNNVNNDIYHLKYHDHYRYEKLINSIVIEGFVYQEAYAYFGNDISTEHFYFQYDQGFVHLIYEKLDSLESILEKYYSNSKFVLENFRERILVDNKNGYFIYDNYLHDLNKDITYLMSNNEFYYSVNTNNYSIDLIKMLLSRDTEYEFINSKYFIKNEYGAYIDPFSGEVVINGYSYSYSLEDFAEINLNLIKPKDDKIVSFRSINNNNIISLLDSDNYILLEFLSGFNFYTSTSELVRYYDLKVIDKNTLSITFNDKTYLIDNTKETKVYDLKYDQVAVIEDIDFYYLNDLTSLNLFELKYYHNNGYTYRDKNINNLNELKELFNNTNLIKLEINKEIKSLDKIRTEILKEKYLHYESIYFDIKNKEIINPNFKIRFLEKTISVENEYEYFEFSYEMFLNLNLDQQITEIIEMYLLIFKTEMLLDDNGYYYNHKYNVLFMANGKINISLRSSGRGYLLEYSDNLGVNFLEQDFNFNYKINTNQNEKMVYNYNYYDNIIYYLNNHYKVNNIYSENNGVVDFDNKISFGDNYPNIYLELVKYPSIDELKDKYLNRNKYSLESYRYVINVKPDELITIYDKFEGFLVVIDLNTNNQYLIKDEITYLINEIKYTNFIDIIKNSEYYQYNSGDYYYDDGYSDLILNDSFIKLNIYLDYFQEYFYESELNEDISLSNYNLETNISETIIFDLEGEFNQELVNVYDLRLIVNLVERSHVIPVYLDHELINFVINYNSIVINFFGIEKTFYFADLGFIVYGGSWNQRLVYFSNYTFLYIEELLRFSSLEELKNYLGLNGSLSAFGTIIRNIEDLFNFAYHELHLKVSSTTESNSFSLVFNPSLIESLVIVREVILYYFDNDDSYYLRTLDGSISFVYKMGYQYEYFELDKKMFSVLGRVYNRFNNYELIDVVVFDIVDLEEEIEFENEIFTFEDFLASEKPTEENLNIHKVYYFRGFKVLVKDDSNYGVYLVSPDFDINQELNNTNSILYYYKSLSFELIKEYEGKTIKFTGIMLGYHDDLNWWYII